MTAEKTPRGLRSVITFIGRRNAGKSSLINAVCDQEISIVSDTAGTTTDAVAKAYELLPFGPVTIYDTAGLDDSGELGEKRIKATEKILFKSDVVILVCGIDGIEEKEKEFIKKLNDLKISFLVAFNKTDINTPNSQSIEYCNENNIKSIEVSATGKQNITELKEKIIDIIPQEQKSEPLLAGDLFGTGDTVLLVVPIDLGAPKGRLILPQVQIIRDILDGNAKALVVKENDITEALTELKSPPKLVICDSQVVKKVAKDIPTDQPFTTFSILFARYKGDLETMVKGANQIDKLQDGDKVLIAEACSHHSQADDIGRVKIPKWLKEYTNKDLEINVCAGHDFPENLEQYSLVIHCGGCMLNRAEMIRRLNECTRRNIPITNYGVAISKTQGVLDGAIKVFGF